RRARERREVERVAEAEREGELRRRVREVVRADAEDGRAHQLCRAHEVLMTVDGRLGRARRARGVAPVRDVLAAGCRGLDAGAGLALEIVRREDLAKPRAPGAPR